MELSLHYLQQKPDEEKPIIIPFNPWLFSGHPNITRRFFEQLENVLSKQTAVPKGIKKTLADFAGVLSEIPLPFTICPLPNGSCYKFYQCYF